MAFPRMLSVLVLLLALPALAQDAVNISLLAEIDQYNQYNDVWGYVAPGGSEYALLGVVNGTSIVNVTNPGTAYETGFIPGSFSIWRDMKTFGTFAYVTTEASDQGLQIIDLSDPENPVLAAEYHAGADSFQTAHNLYIEEGAGRAYLCGANGVPPGNPRTFILDLAADPTNPPVLGFYTDAYVHDLYVRDNVAYLAEINDWAFSVFDVSNAQSPVRLAGPVNYPCAKTHNLWLSGSGDVLATTDEIYGGFVWFWDVRDLGNITASSKYAVADPATIVHNVTMKDETAYIAYYTDGLHIVDVSDPVVPARVGFYDTSAGPNGEFESSWGVYPFLPSGRVLVSDRSRGLLVLEVDDDLGEVRGTVTDDQGSAVAGALVEVLGTGEQFVTGAVGRFALVVPAGSYTLRVTVEGFFTQTPAVSVISSQTTQRDLTMLRPPTADIVGRVVGLAVGSGPAPLVGARLTLVETGFSTTTDADGFYSLKSIPLGTYELEASFPGYGVAIQAISLTAAMEAPFELVRSLFFDDGRQDLGWSFADAQDDAVTGRWVRDIPVATRNGDVQPGFDASGQPDYCFLTGNALPEDLPSVADVDMGITTLTSPLIDMSQLNSPMISYARWFSNTKGQNPAQDLLFTQVSNDGGTTWTVLEIVFVSQTPWTRRDFRVTDFVTPSSQMRVRFVATDLQGSSLVEALIDDVEVYEDPRLAIAVPPIPRNLRLRAWPNPFNPATRLAFDLVEGVRVHVEVLDVRGRRIAVLVDEWMPAGEHSLPWLARDAHGRPLASGVYFVRLAVAGATRSLPLTLLK